MAARFQGSPETVSALLKWWAQRITAFDHDDLPVSMGILVDESWSMRPKRADVLSAAETLIEQSNRLSIRVIGKMSSSF